MAGRAAAGAGCWPTAEDDCSAAAAVAVAGETGGLAGGGSGGAQGCAAAPPPAAVEKVKPSKAGAAAAEGARAAGAGTTPNVKALAAGAAGAGAGEGVAPIVNVKPPSAAWPGSETVFPKVKLAACASATGVGAVFEKGKPSNAGAAAEPNMSTLGGGAADAGDVGLDSSAAPPAAAAFAAACCGAEAPG